MIALSLVVSAGCGGTATVGGRERCWPERDRREAGLWEGILHIEATGGQLETPEFRVLPLLPGTLEMRIGESGVGELVHGPDVVAQAGDYVTLFGGLGSLDGTLVVCGIEARRQESH